MLKKYRPYIIIFYILSAASLITASFIDLKLGIFLNNPDDAFSIWFEATGEMPCRLICTFAGVLIFYLAEKTALKIFGLIVDLGGSAYLGYHIAHYLFLERYNIAFGLIFGLGIALLALYIGQFIKVDDNLKKAFIILSVAGIIVMFAQLGLIEISKVLWGRVRFRDLIKDGSYDRFTAWYIINGVTGNRSFPSGHTAGAAMSYLMMALPFVSPKWAKRRYLCFALPLIYTSIVAYTRLVMGAHYLSDVTVGGAIGFTVTIIAIGILDKKYFTIKE